MVRALAAVVVILLGLAWFVLHSLDPDNAGHVPAARAGGDGSAPAAHFPNQGADPVSLRSETLRAGPGTGESLQEDSLRAALPVTNVAATDDESASLARTFERAQALLDQGDRAGAEQLLRSTRQAATSTNAAARAGLLLAGVVSGSAERRRLYSEAFHAGVVMGREYDEVGTVLRQLNADPGSSLLPLLDVETYEVAGGDALWNLCNRTFPQRFGVRPEVGLIKLVNGLAGDGLRVGQRLLVPRQKLVLRVDSSQHGLVAFLGDVVLSCYRVGLGQDGRTPRGAFAIEVKQENPTWWRDGKAIPFGDPENVLGTRWMGFEDRPGTTGFGIHGTAYPESIGKNESMGCVRLRNEEVQELFEFVSRGTAVEIL